MGGEQQPQQPSERYIPDSRFPGLYIVDTRPYADEYYAGLLQADAYSPNGVAISFHDIITPLFYSDLNFRECMVSGLVTAHGEDPEKGPWASVRVIHHEMITRDPENAAHETEVRAFSTAMQQAEAYPEVITIVLGEEKQLEPGQKLVEQLEIPEAEMVIYFRETYLLGLGPVPTIDT